MAFDPLAVDVIKIAIILVASYVAIVLVDFFVKRAGETFDLELTVTQVLQEIVKYSVIALAIVLILNELGINISALVLSLGILGIVVGFAARDTLSNFISGLFVIGTKSFKVGDIIEVSGQIGTVTKMGFRVTNMVDLDNKVITIPNSIFSTDLYTNYTCRDMRRVELPITIPYELDLEDAIESMVEKALSLNWTLDDPKPKVMIKEFSDLGIKASLNVWTDDPWSVISYRSILAREVKKLMVHRNA